LNPISGANGINGDYRLAHDSPAIDAGSSTVVGPSETDLRSLTRIVAGAPPYTPAARDLGAYEYQHAAPVAAPTASPASVAPGQPVSFDGSGSSDVDGEALTYSWTFDDGATATGLMASHAFATAGAHSASLTVTDPTGLTGNATAQVSVVTPPSSVPAPAA